MTVTTEQALSRLRDIRGNKTDNLFITWGVKCYWGAFDSKTERVHQFRDRAMKLVKVVWPEAHVTYYPAGSFYIAFNRLQILSPDMPSWESAFLVLLDKVLEAHPAPVPTQL